MKISPIPSSTEPVQDLLSNLKGDRKQWNDGRAMGAGPSSQPMITLLNDLKNAALTLWNSGTTAQRPVDPVLSQIYFDTTTGGFVYCSAIRAGAVPAVWTPLGSGGGSTSPLTTKGDVWGYTTADARVPIGADALVATADSTKAAGWDWKPIPASGTLQSMEFTASGTWTQPSGVTSAWITMIGGGGGGSTTITAALGGGGGGSGELVQMMAVIVSGNVTVTVGAKGPGGAAGQASAQPGVAGGDSSFGSQYVARGGLGGATTGVSGAGGGIGGNAAKGVASPGAAGANGIAEAPTYFGGGSGGGGGNTITAIGGAGSAAAGYPTAPIGGAAASSQAGGGGGASTVYGVGANGGAGGAIGNSATAANYGSGGGGGGGKVTTTIGGGDGAPGYVLVQWVA